MESPDPSPDPPSASSAARPRPPEGDLPTAPVPGFAAPIFVPQPVSAGRRLITWIGWAGFLFCGFLVMRQWSAQSDYYHATEGIQEQFHSGVVNGRDKVAIISLRGIIMEGDGFVKRQIDRVRKDDRVKAVVLRVDSPGGTVTGSDYIYHHLTKLRKDRDIPIVVSMGSIAASGGYYVSMAVGDQQKCIFAEPTTTTGSIGVIVPHYDLSGLLARYDVRDDSITSHPRKQILSMTRTMSPEGREIIQVYVDESFGRFKEIVKSGRPRLRRSNKDTELLDAATGQNLATGEIFTASKAKKFGLVDEIGFIEDAIERAVELAQLDKDQVRIVRYQRPPSLMNLVGIPQAANESATLSTLLELNTPRAFYLATSLPAFASSRRHGK